MVTVRPEIEAGYNWRMSAITLPARSEAHPHLRSLNVMRDLPQVADLIETCFANTMDGEGLRYVRDLRRAGYDAGIRGWAARVSESASLPLTGYVWEEGGTIVGNASMIPFGHQRQRIYLIANVAVHPDHRRRGIARTLTERALIHARQRRAEAVWLHVRSDNAGALKLYEGLGFVERARRTLWHVASSAPAPPETPNISIRPRHPRYWPAQRSWLQRFYSDELAWHRPWSLAVLKPGFWNWLYLFFVDLNIQQWAAIKDGRLQAVLAYLPNGREQELFAAAGPGSDPQALTALLFHARRSLSQRPQLSLEFPAGVYDEEIRSAGFEAHRTLVWMRASAAT